VRIKLGDKELEVDNFTETRIRKGDEEVPVFSFEYKTPSIQERMALKELLSVEPIALSLEGKEPIQVAVENFVESYYERLPSYHFKVSLIPFRRLHTGLELLVEPQITLIQVLEGLIAVLEEKRILTRDEIKIASKNLFLEERSRDEILKLYYGREFIESLRSMNKKEDDKDYENR
jgi:hypothetical protein